jgi:hypothetical protein
MTDTPKDQPFEPFITVSLGNRKPEYSNYVLAAIAVTSNCPGVSAIHWYDPAAARTLAAEITRLADALDPPPIQTAIPPKPKRGRPAKKKAKRK